MCGLYELEVSSDRVGAELPLRGDRRVESELGADCL